jgi:hypothetical protein
LKKLNLGQAFSILANLGVLIGILLLAYELNQNREMMSAQARNSVAEMLVGLLALEISDPVVADIQVRRKSGESLTAVETYRFETLEEAYWRFRENVHYQYRNGLYQEDEYLALREVWLQEIDNDEMVWAIYCGRRSRAPQAFTAEIDGAMARPCD